MKGKPKHCLNCGAICRWSGWMPQNHFDWVCTDCGFEIESSEYGIRYRRPKHLGFGFCEVPEGALLVVASEQQ